MPRHGCKAERRTPCGCPTPPRELVSRSFFLLFGITQHRGHLIPHSFVKQPLGPLQVKLPGGMALLNAADAFVAPTPASAPSLRGSNAAMAQAETLRARFRRIVSESLVQLGMPQAQSAPSSSALPAIACGGAVAAAAVAAQRTGRAVKCQWAVLACGRQTSDQLLERPAVAHFQPAHQRGASQGALRISFVPGLCLTKCSGPGTKELGSANSAAAVARSRLDCGASGGH